MYKLDYFDLISPNPLRVDKIGSIICPKLSDISRISYFTYGLYVSSLSLTPEKYFENMEKYGLEVDAETILKTTKFDLIKLDKDFAKTVENALNFFFVEKVFYDSENEIFVLVNQESEDLNSGTVVGIIGKQNYNTILSFILQRLYINQDENEVDDLSKVKSKRGKKIYEKILKGRKQMRQAKEKNGNNELTLPNIISSVAAFSNNTNYSQIWDLTIYQLFDMFNRLQLIDQYNIQSTQVSVWGDKEKQFKIGLWNKNIYESKNEKS